MNVPFLDHILWAAPDLAGGCALFAKLTGVMPAGGGVHSSGGTRNELAGLGDGIYLEVIAPDPAQGLDRNLGARIARADGPHLLAFALRHGDLSSVESRAVAVGLGTQRVEMSRPLPGGTPLSWELLFLRDHRWGGRLPFFIDWKSSRHPSATAPRGCRLVDFRLHDPLADELRHVFVALGVPVEVAPAPRLEFEACLETPRGRVTFRNAITEGI